MSIIDTRTRQRNTIINADDFGMSASANEGIIAAFLEGLISTTSLMTNMPAFGDACHLARKHSLEGRIGVHLNLSEGKPLTSSISTCRRFCDKAGNFLPRSRAMILNRNERCVVEEEFRVQIQSCIDAGIKPTHLDSHHHYHTEWAIGSVVISLAKQFGIEAVRPTRNCGCSLGYFKGLYKHVFNYRLRLNGIQKVQHFGGVADVASLRPNKRSDVEIMVHPRMSSDGLLLDLYNSKSLRAHLKCLGDIDRLNTYDVSTSRIFRT